MNGFKGDYLTNSKELCFFDIIKEEYDKEGKTIFVPDALGIISNAIQPRDRLLVRFSHDGNRTSEAVGHLEEVICRPAI